MLISEIPRQLGLMETCDYCLSLTPLSGKLKHLVKHPSRLIINWLNNNGWLYFPLFHWLESKILIRGLESWSLLFLHWKIFLHCFEHARCTVLYLTFIVHEELASRVINCIEWVARITHLVSQNLTTKLLLRPVAHLVALRRISK